MRAVLEDMVSLAATVTPPYLGGSTALEVGRTFYFLRGIDMSYTPTRKEIAAARILERAAELLDTKGWTQGSYARNAEGCRVPYISPQATQFCALGALYRVGRSRAPSSRDTAVHGFSVQIGNTTVGRWNDNRARKKGQVIAAMHKAAEHFRSGAFRKYV